jgi:hypothetical protein
MRGEAILVSVMDRKLRYGGRKMIESVAGTTILKPHSQRECRSALFGTSLSQ